MEDSVDTNIDSEFRMILKKLYKKDSLTRLKVHLDYSLILNDIN